jgi:hypothetical protein
MRSVAILAMVVVLSVGVAEARDPEPLARIPLAPLGYQTMTPELLLGGGSMLTVDFVDHDHLLISFAVHRLMKREADERADDEDRTVVAALVELPTGKLLARAEWRLHDHWRYLWNLGGGRFLLRVRDRLSVIAPMEESNATDVFRETPLLNSSRHIVAMLLSADADLLTVESIRRVEQGVANDVTLVDPTLADPAQSESAPVQVNFFRLSSVGAGASGLRVTPAGAIRARVVVSLPLTTAGYLDLVADGRNRWLFNFDQYSGKINQLTSFDTSCFPRANFVDSDEFVAFGCRGGEDRQLFAGFNLKGDAMWQQSLPDSYVAPTFAFATMAGRFALGRVLVTSAMDEDGELPQSVVSAQEVRVLQSYDGRLLFKINCLPVERSGENFALTADGLQLAVVRERVVNHPATLDYDAYTAREAAVEVFALPVLTEKDLAAVKAAEAMTPQDAGARADQSLERITSLLPPVAANTASSAGSVSSPSGAEHGAPTATLGDPLPDAPRARPTLYGPDERSAETPATEK